MKHRLQLYIEEGAMPPRELAQRLWSVIQAWRATEPRADFRYEARDGMRPVSSDEDCAVALEESTYTWRFGEESRVSYEPLVFVGSPDAPVLSVKYTCGIGAIDVPGIFAPSRFTAVVDRALTSDDGAALLQSWMLKAVEILRPRFGHAGSLEVPRPVTPLEPWPVPPVGWLTYLGHAFPVPAKLPHPSAAYPAPDGTLVVAHPELFLDYKSAHQNAVNALRDALALGA